MKFNLLIFLTAILFSSCSSELNIKSNTTSSVLSLETEPGGSGSAVTAESLVDGQPLPIYAVLRSKLNNRFISNAEITNWTSDQKLGFYSTSPSNSTVFTPNSSAGTVTLTATCDGLVAKLSNINLSYTVSSIPNLKFWVKADSLIGLPDGTPVNTWTDSSGMSEDSTQVIETDQPLFQNKVVNNQPALKFDGINSKMTFPDAIVVNTDYTIFAVGARSTGAHENMFLGGTVGGNELNLAFGYRQDSGGFLPGTFDLAHYGNDVYSSVTAFTTTTYESWTGVFSQTAGKEIYNNGVSFAVDSSKTGPLVGASGTMIGYWPFLNVGFEGNISEIIVYGRALDSNELSQVEGYLKTKYGL
jgi:hypothetical protein